MSSNLIPERKDIKDSDKWDLSPLYQSDDIWNNDFNKLKNNISQYSKYKGKLSQSAITFYECLEFDLETGRLLEKLYTYAHLKNDEDKTNSHYNELLQKISMLYTQITENSSFLTPEIQAIPEKILNSFLREENLKIFNFEIKKIIRYKKHTLDEEKEKLLSLTSDAAGAASSIFSQLNNADMKFGKIIDDKEDEIELSHGNFITFLQSGNRDIRKKAFFQFYKAYDSHKHSISSSLYYSNRKDWIYSKIRSYPSCRSKSLFHDNVNETVYDNLLETVKQNITPLSRYMYYRKKALKLDNLHIYDTYIPLIDDVNFKMSYEEAVDTCVEALEILGNDYTSTLKNGLLNGWVDKYENIGKRSGAYSSGCYDSSPYILLNYNEKNLDSVYTLIHEAGHSMHSYYSKMNQPYLYHNYTIFAAEVASTFNEFLLTQYLLKKFKNDEIMTKYILNREIDNIRGTLIRQTMFAEFELFTHSRIEKDEPLSLDTIRKKYRELLEIYFDNSIEIDDILELEALRIPHFYSAFYVYKYATGISAAIALGKKAVNNSTDSIEKYLNFLKLGGSMFPIDELKAAGVDMSTPDPIKAALDYFNELVNTLTDN